MATTRKKRSFDAAFKLRVVEYAEQDTNGGAGSKLVLMKIIVATLEL